MLKAFWKLWRVGLWAPVLVLAMHIFLVRVVHAYTFWPSLDIPVHFTGGLAIAYCVARCFQYLPRESVRKSRMALLELLLIVCLTATAAVFWEFAEFTADRLLGTNLQLGLSDTMGDLATGILAALVVATVRARQLGVGVSGSLDIVQEWIKGKAETDS